MEHAIEAVEQGESQYGTKSGLKTYLTIEELVNFLIWCAKIGYPHTKKQVFSLVQQIVDDKGIHTTITNGWWEHFCHRHPQVTLRTAVPLSIARAMASDRMVLNTYYDLLETTLKSNGIFNNPVHIFNCD